jgi:hypothetical protein
MKNKTFRKRNLQLGEIIHGNKFRIIGIVFRDKTGTYDVYYKEDFIDDICYITRSKSYVERLFGSSGKVRLTEFLRTSNYINKLNK